jgi:hypothetical protein
MSEDCEWVTYTIRLKRGHPIAPGVWTAVDDAEDRQFIMIADNVSDPGDSVGP